MRIRLEKIGEAGLDIDEPVSAQWLSDALGDDSSYAPTTDGRLVAHLLRAEDVVHVRGQATVGLRAECSRCLEPVTLQLEAPLEVAMLPREQEPKADEDGELQGDDLGIATYKDNEIDLAAVVHDGIFLALPMVALCREDCAGLCPECGANRNTNPCKCEGPIDPRLMALKNIKLN